MAIWSWWSGTGRRLCGRIPGRPGELCCPCFSRRAPPCCHSRDSGAGKGHHLPLFALRWGAETRRFSIMTATDSLSHHLLEDLLSKTILRLLLAAALGGIIGLERELKQRPAGLRTNMFICFGAAMFTILSAEIAPPGDSARIAAQIIPGIGFIGAGSILHSKGGVTGLTTAATLFVVASIGMATGAGFYLPAVFASLLILLALQFLGWVERRLGFKPVLMYYSIVTDKPIDE